MADFEVGDFVTGQVFGYDDVDFRVSGTVWSIDSVGDPVVKIERFLTGAQEGYTIGNSVYLIGRTVTRNELVGVTGPAPARTKTLRKAESLITGDRNRTYGDPTDNFRDIAEVWTTYLKHKLRDGETISSGDTAWMMIGLKMVRAKAQPSMDNWVDAAGYAGCGSEADLAEGVIE